MMLLIFVIGVLSLMLLPLLPAMLELVRKTDVTSLGINRLHTGSSNVFAENYRKYLESHGLLNQLQNYWNSRLSAWSPLLEKKVEEEVLATAGLAIPADFSCLKEVYCAGDVETRGSVILRSILAEGDLVLGEQNSVVRWASARNMLIGRNATLFGRMVAQQEMCFTGPASFQRIQAATIRMGKPWQRVSAMGPYRVFDILQLEHTIFFNDDIRRVVVEGNLSLPDHSFISGHLVVHGTLKIGHGCYIQGSVKASGNVHVGNAVTVEGSMVSDMSVSCLSDCVLLGPVVAERFVYLGSRCVLGSTDSPISVSSSSIRLKLPMLVHGTVWARSRGAIRHERASGV
ncbi:polymer-forming cytoskeletal protein [Aquitalea denitrificans]|uniref:polymer-forming cytoskeletal protein n=1 Tax=Aquitalea denitrificans TaxID=519081 RepID=UPI00135C2674|nr:hypothetical protein [Aquitalea denitrificans]